MEPQPPAGQNPLAGRYQTGEIRPNSGPLDMRRWPIRQPCRWRPKPNTANGTSALGPKLIGDRCSPPGPSAAMANQVALPQMSTVSRCSRRFMATPQRGRFCRRSGPRPGTTIIRAAFHPPPRDGSVRRRWRRTNSVSGIPHPSLSMRACCWPRNSSDSLALTPIGTATKRNPRLQRPAFTLSLYLPDVRLPATVVQRALWRPQASLT